MMRLCRTFAVRACVVLLAAWAVFPAGAWAGSIRTLDGKFYTGEIHLNADGTFTVQPRQGAAVSVAPGNLLQADFKATETATVVHPMVIDDRLPNPPWQTADVGRAALPGKVRYVDGTLSVKGAGGPMENREDSCFFIYQALDGDGQIVVRLRDFQPGQQAAKVGVVIRENLTAMPCEAMLTLMVGRGMAFLTRQTNVLTFTLGPVSHGEAVPVWFLLSRRGKVFQAEKSADGEHWLVVGHQELPMGPKALIGIWITSHDPNSFANAVFDNIVVGPVNDNPKPAPPPPLDVTKTVVLKSGDVVGNVNITQMSNETIRFTDSNGRLFSVPLSDVARLAFAAVPPAVLDKIPPHTVGVLKPSGDFVEGDFSSFDGPYIKLSSVLFGLQAFRSPDYATALILRDVEPIPSAWVVRTANGSVYMARSLKINADELVIDDLSLGEAHVPAPQLIEIRTGSERSTYLSALEPTRVEVPSGVAQSAAWSNVGSVAGRPVALGAFPCDHALTVLTGATLSYTLDGPYKLLYLHYGLPDASLPTVAARLVVLADGHEIFRGPERTSLDDPLTLSIPIVGAKTVMLRLESAAPFPCSVVLADAQFVK